MEDETDQELDYSNSTDSTDETDSGDTLEAAPALEAQPAVTATTFNTPGPLIMTGQPQAPRIPQPGPQLLSPQEAATRETMRRLYYRLKDSPLAETEAAVAAALKFQGLRQYQSDVASGVHPSTALARSAPLMFSGPRNSTLGQAASLVRAGAPRPAKLIDVAGVLYMQNPDNTLTQLTQPKARPQKMYNVGGVLYREGENGQMLPVTPAKAPTAGRANQFDLAEYNSTLRQLAQVRQEAANDRIGSPLFQQHQATLKILGDQLQAIRTRGAAPGALPGASNRVRVRHPNGKFGSIPASQLDSALRQGYTEVK